MGNKSDTITRNKEKSVLITTNEEITLKISYSNLYEKIGKNENNAHAAKVNIIIKLSLPWYLNSYSIERKSKPLAY